jgi:hypothetical protein
MPQTYDVFISHAGADKPWVRTLALNLHNFGLEVWFDEWRIGPGDVLVHELDAGILNSRSGVVVVTEAAMNRPWVLEEYAAIMTRAVHGKQRVIPVILGTAEMPPLLASRLYIDFRGADGPVYESKVKALAAALKGEKVGPPPRVVPIPQSRYLPEGAFDCSLAVARDKVVFTGWPASQPAEHKPEGVSHSLIERLQELERQRKARHEAARPERGPQQQGWQSGSPLHACLLAVGAELSKAFLDGHAGSALFESVRQADLAGASVCLGLETVEPELAPLPWETLVMPQQAGFERSPLVLNPCVNFYRKINVQGKMTAHTVPGPLRILAAIGSPEAQNPRGELLDYELELSKILDALSGAISQN